MVANERLKPDKVTVGLGSMLTWNLLGYWNNLLQSTKSVNIREQVVIFLHIIGHNVRFRVIGSRYYRSTETIYRYFRVVLRAILKLYKLVIRLPDESIPSEIRNNPRFYPYFKDCIGALDGTHVHTSVPLNIQGRFRNHKGGITQNVLAAITFDLKFSYVLAGWEGSAHGYRILSDALSCSRGLRIPEGKYYLADAGYGIRNGYITPYHGVRYHLKEFSDQGPKNAKELFNLRHSSLRITIERVLGILKKQFRVLDAEPFWNFQTQVDIVLACCIIQNHIMGVDPNDLLNYGLYEEPESDLIIPTLTEREEREEAREWSAKETKLHRLCGLIIWLEILRSFARTFADIDLDDGNQDSVPIDGDNEEIEEVRTNVSSSGTSKRKRKNVQESVVDEQIKFVGEQPGKIANALEQFIADKTPHLYEEVISMEEEGLDDDFLCFVFDYLVSHESEAKAFLVKSKKHRKIWLQKFSQG
ncbi:hypothetical protein J1N35_010531 [Gossypium stocksii]|uniref:DDE Tnp4 domain-containing protein n=1 Tax=Gossypium stocksii TaxID=47602 RepID=A0A9D3W1X8_9ROSI|nr:hypothetical protein J1N35_021981 [Gossypium stocksii]KAH1106763.1 hypothetical protein J1N35_010531 [Gossypium stocksii]